MGLAAGQAHAVDSLGVGWGILKWTNAVASRRLVALSPDSIWMWDVRPNANLAPGIPERGGFALFPGGLGTTFLDGAHVLYDGDEETAFNPDDFAEKTELERTTPIFIDLGATFGVNRIRLFPRLDGEHRHFFPRAFVVATSEGTQEGANLLQQRFQSVVDFFPANPNREPVVERRFPSRPVRHVLLAVREGRPWEIAELEVYGDGTLPQGEFVSVPILATQGPRPLWGRVRYDGGDIARLPVTVQTRSGPDREPVHYFRLTGVGSDQERVSASEYARLDSTEKGPILPNPAWSPWETVTDGMVRSPGVRPFIQFRMLMSQPGTAIHRLVIEYLNPPIAEALEAEIAPLVVDPGRETPFTISLRAQIRRLRTDGSLLPNGDTGFQSLRIRTEARISQVEKVLVDDREVEFGAAYQAGQGATVLLRRTVLQDGTFIQVALRGAVFRDATRFEVQAVDQRLVDGRLQAVYQSAREEDVDPLSVGGSLVVRLRGPEQGLPLLADVEPGRGVFTPNGDGANDVFALSYSLLKLTQPARVYFEVFDLGGRLVQGADLGEQGSGALVHFWDGRDESGRRVMPGLYLYRLRVEADAESGEHQGVVGVAY